jgi:transcription antitermination factor NusG
MNELSDNRLWYIAQVMPRHEMKVREKLTQLGYEACVPSRREQHVYKNRSKRVCESVFIPSVVFVRLTEEERSLMVTFPFIKKFLVNNALPLKRTGKAVHPLATFTDEQMMRMQERMQTTDISPELASQYPMAVIESLNTEKITCVIHRN